MTKSIPYDYGHSSIELYAGSLKKIVHKSQAEKLLIKKIRYLLSNGLSIYWLL